MFQFSIAFVYCVRTMATGGDHERMRVLLVQNLDCPVQIGEQLERQYSCDHDRRASIDPSMAIALVPGIRQAAIAVDKSRDSSRQKPR